MSEAWAWWVRSLAPKVLDALDLTDDARDLRQAPDDRAEAARVVRRIRNRLMLRAKATYKSAAEEAGRSPTGAQIAIALGEDGAKIAQVVIALNEIVLWLLGKKTDVAGAEHILKQLASDAPSC